MSMSYDSTDRQKQKDRQAELARMLRQRVTAPLAKALATRERGEVIDDAAAIAEEAMAALREALVLAGIEVGKGPEWGRTLNGDAPEFTAVRELIAGYWDYLERRKELAGTGIGALDRALMGGLEAGRLYVILGAPGSGKTTFVNQIGDWLAESHPVFLVTSEDSPYVLLCKTLSRRSRIEYSALLRGYSTERPRIQAALDEYAGSPQARNLAYLDASGSCCLQGMVERALRHFEGCGTSASGFPVMILDYLQRLARAEDAYIRAETGGAGALGADMRQATTAYMERLAALAREVGCAVIAVSSMSRGSGYSLERGLSAAKESGDIEYAADFIASLGPEPNEEGAIDLAEPGTFAWKLMIAKNRQGLTALTGADIPLLWNPVYQYFAQRELLIGEHTVTDLDEDQGRRSPRCARGIRGREARRRS